MATAFFPLNCFSISLSSRQSAVITCHSQRNSSTRLSFRYVVYSVMRSSICETYQQEYRKSSYRGCPSLVRLHNSTNLPRHLLHSTLHLLLGGDGWRTHSVSSQTHSVSSGLLWSPLVSSGLLGLRQPSRWLPLRAVTSHGSNVSLTVLTL